jgi:hypothetical protein
MDAWLEAGSSRSVMSQQDREGMHLCGYAAFRTTNPSFLFHVSSAGGSPPTNQQICISLQQHCWSSLMASRQTPSRFCMSVHGHCGTAPECHAADVTQQSRNQTHPLSSLCLEFPFGIGFFNLSKTPRPVCDLIPSACSCWARHADNPWTLQGGALPAPQPGAGSPTFQCQNAG